MVQETSPEEGQGPDAVEEPICPQCGGAGELPRPAGEGIVPCPECRGDAATEPEDEEE